MEWLSSEMIYYEAFSAAEKLRKLKIRAFSPEAGIYHYLNMAKPMKTELRGSEVKIKKYFTFCVLSLPADGLKHSAPYRRCHFPYLRCLIDG